MSTTVLCASFYQNPTSPRECVFCHQTHLINKKGVSVAHHSSRNGQTESGFKPRQGSSAQE